CFTSAEKPYHSEPATIQTTIKLTANQATKTCLLEVASAIGAAGTRSSERQQDQPIQNAAAREGDEAAGPLGGQRPERTIDDHRAGNDSDTYCRCGQRQRNQQAKQPPGDGGARQDEPAGVRVKRTVLTVERMVSSQQMKRDRHGIRCGCGRGGLEAVHE